MTDEEVVQVRRLWAETVARARERMRSRSEAAVLAARHRLPGDPRPAQVRAWAADLTAQALADLDREAEDRQRAREGLPIRPRLDRVVELAAHLVEGGDEITEALRPLVAALVREELNRGTQDGRRTVARTAG